MASFPEEKNIEQHGDTAWGRSSGVHVYIQAWIQAHTTWMTDLQWTFRDRHG